MKRKNEQTNVVNAQQLLTINDVTSQLNISRTTLHELNKSGKIKFHRINRMVRYKPEDVDNYLSKVAS